MLFGNSGLLSINPLLYTLQHDPGQAFEPVSTFSDLPFILVVSASLPANSVAELLALAVTGNTRSDSLPAVPTLQEEGVDMEVGSWTAVLAPKGTSESIVARLGALIHQVTELPDVQQTLAAQGAQALASTPQQLSDRMARDRA